MDTISALAIHIKGLVQGVGFRPFVYRLAIRNNIKGWVVNGNDGVRIHAEGSGRDLDNFTRELTDLAPAASQIKGMDTSKTDLADYDVFLITKSTDSSDEITEISPDIMVCPDCLQDMKSQTHRTDYPFINCTNCGPRFSIIKGVPYDRPLTTMQPFKMCPECLKEYSDVNDRRFHAQPVACNTCGPHYELICKDKKYNRIADILDVAVKLIHEGKILAVKGIGGFHLACDAGNEEAVSRLRKRKVREGKPFAVMFRGLAEAREYMHLNPVEEESLLSWRRPIVIVKNKDDKKLAYNVSNGFETTGAMLPYMPFHYLFFERSTIPAIVLTSGNLADEPVMIGNDEAVAHLESIADAFLVYNRDIYNRTDDSVMMFTGNTPRLIRRSRGFAPSPVTLSQDVDGIFAAGAELVNCFCVGKGNKAFMSQHIGDLKNLETLEFYTQSLGRYLDMFRVKPTLVAADMHPDYLSTRFAEEFASKNAGITLTHIQHHHAHIASCMAEHGIDRPVIGISMDGTGYGPDGNTWGFEVLKCDLAGFERINHLEYIPQPGGDRANAEPWRMALAYLYQYVDHDLENIRLPFMSNIEPEKIRIIKAALDNNIQCPLTSSAGRLFDAVAAITGICTNSSFHAEAPMRLENMADFSLEETYNYEIGSTIDPKLIIQGIVKDIEQDVPNCRISGKFHRTIAEIIIQATLKAGSETGIKSVVLSGGSFQNRFILEESENRLKNAGFIVYTHSEFPSNDGGIALGQLAIAAKRRQTGSI
jgi:hydrogenase maturation protein HypF